MAKTIGIVGGGQLGRMLTSSAHKLGFKVIVLDPTPNSPAGQLADLQIIGSFKDEQKIRELADKSDYMTFEIESANAKALEDLVKKGYPVNPSPKTLAIIKDKFLQKKFLKDAGIPVADFMEIGSSVILGRSETTTPESQKDSGRASLARMTKDIIKAAQAFGYPFLLKARMDAYDGRGNALVKNETDIAQALEKLSGKSLYAEAFVDFEKEISVMVARSLKGEVVAYPVSENAHLRNILQISIMPAQIAQSAFRKAEALAKDVVEHLDGAGVFGIEMFLTQDNEVLVNEIAPRVHNSGHHTIEACKTSQFEQHIRAITGMKLGSTEMVVPAVVMINILGERDDKANPEGVEKAEKIPGVSVHLYAKMETRIDRKMGHITAIGNTVAEAMEKALLARKYITI